MVATKTKEGDIQLQASMANRGWAKSIGDILSQLGNPDALYRLKLDKRSDDLQRQQSDAAMFGRLCMTQAGHRAWSMSIVSELPPENWAGVLDQDPAMAQAAFARLKNEACVVRAAWALQDDTCEDWNGIQSALGDLWVHKQTLVQELWQHAEFWGWTFDAVHGHIYRLTDTLASTKEVLEDRFGFLGDHAARDAKFIQQASPERMFFYTTASCNLNKAEFNVMSLLPGELANKDAVNYARGRDVYEMPRRHKTKSKTISEIRGFLKEGNRRKMNGVKASTDEVKPAGQASDFRSVASMLALTQLAGDNFRDISSCWTACLLQATHLFYEKSSKKVFLSLGFESKAVWMWEVTQVIEGELFLIAECNLPAAECIARIHPVLNKFVGGKDSTDDEMFCGVPVEACPPFGLPQNSNN